jgi:hypothetical protein
MNETQKDVFLSQLLKNVFNRKNNAPNSTTNYLPSIALAYNKKSLIRSDQAFILIQKKELNPYLI